MSSPAPAGGPNSCDVLIVGAGPAGLTAAVYVARFRRSVMLVDDNRSRAAYIPLSRNCPGFAGGISGIDLLRELRAQCEKHGVGVRPGRVDQLHADEVGFVATSSAGTIRAPAVILATGIVDHLPPMSNVRDAILSGHVRLCPICDAFEAGDLRVGVFGPASDAIPHARYLRSFSRHVLLASPSVLKPRQIRELRDHGIETLSDASRCSLERDGVRIETRDRASVLVDALYPAMGSHPNSELVHGLGVRCNPKGCIRADAHQRTNIEGIFAIGDVVEGLNQISVAAGQAAVAASAVHRYLPFKRL